MEHSIAWINLKMPAPLMRHWKQFSTALQFSEALLKILNLILYLYYCAFLCMLKNYYNYKILNLYLPATKQFWLHVLAQGSINLHLTRNLHGQRSQVRWCKNYLQDYWRQHFIVLKKYNFFSLIFLTSRCLLNNYFIFYVQTTSCLKYKGVFLNQSCPKYKLLA